MKCPRFAIRSWLWSSSVALFLATSVAAQPAHLGPETCGSLGFGFGPFDYRTATAEQRRLVEGAHFTPALEGRGKPIKNRMYIAADIQYTLGAFPNHPRALLAMMRVADKEKRDPPRGALWRVECYFERAIRFQNDDAGVRLAYGVFLTRKNRKAEAVEQLMMADSLAPASAEASFHYNLGLAFFDVGEFEHARMHAHAAYTAGVDLPGLKSKLERAGKWREPVRDTSDRAPESRGSSEAAKH